jgi:hypothetical protein
VRIGEPGGCNAHLKIASLVAGMVAGADSIQDMALLRHGGMDRLFTGVRAPSTLGTFLRTFTFGHVRQLDAVSSRLLINLARHAPLLPGAGELAYIDIDDTMRQTYGYAKQGAGRGYTGVKGLNALITAKAAGATGLRVLRADSAFYGYDVIAACRRNKTRFSITARQDPAVRKAIATIGPDAWTPIKYTNAIYDEDQRQWISDAEVAEIGYTAFSSRPKTNHVTARLIVRRVRDLNPRTRASCSPPTAITRYSVTARCRCCRQNRRTAPTPSSTRSSPTSRTARSRTYRPGGSGPTAPGWSAPRWPSTSPAPPAPSPPSSTRRPPPARSGPGSSPSQPDA